MAIDKSQKPTNLVPRSFGGEKNNFSNDLIANGFEPNTPETYNGDNLNYQLDATGKELDYCEKVVDYINGLGVGKTPIVNANNKLDETQVGLKVYSATETFGLGEWVKGTVNDVVGLYESLKPANVGNDLTNSTYWKKVEFGGGGWTPSLLQPFWSEYKLDRMDMLRADTFSWQNGVTYSAAYNLLLEEYNNTASTEQTENEITFKVTPRGFRIADATQEQAILNLYNTIGVAWYYILDTTNTRFKLPRTKYGFVGLRDTVGKYVPESLPQHKHFEFGTTGISPGDDARLHLTPDAQALPFNLINGYAACTLPKTDSPATVGLSSTAIQSSAYQDNAPVQQCATQMYLYFYVGEYTQTAVEQTAGLNAELFNEKMDRDLSNRATNIHFIIETYQNGTSWYRVYDDGWCEQGGYRIYPTSNITFLKPFKDTNFAVITQPTGKHIITGAVATFQANYNYTTTDFQTIANVNITSFVWLAVGYIN